MLKEMEHSFHLTEARELASGRKKPEKFGRPLPAASKPRPGMVSIPKRNTDLQVIVPKDGAKQQNQPANKKRKKPKKSQGAPAQVAVEINKSKAKAQSPGILPNGPTKQEKESNPAKKRPLDSSKVDSGGPKKKQKKNADSKPKLPIVVPTKGAAPLKKKNKSEKRVNGKGPVPVPVRGNPAKVVSISLADKGFYESDADSQDQEVLKGNWRLEDSIHDDFGDGVSDLFRAPRIFKAPKSNKELDISLPAPFNDFEVANAHQLEPNSKGVVRKITVFEGTPHANSCSEESDGENCSEEEKKISLFEGTPFANGCGEESEDDDWSPDDGSSCSDEIDSEDFDTEESYSEESFDSETFDFSLYNSDLDSTFEPESSNEGSDSDDSYSMEFLDGENSDDSTDSLPPHLKPEPLIIEEIFDDEVSEKNSKSKELQKSSHSSMKVVDDSLQMALVLKQHDDKSEGKREEPKDSVEDPPKSNGKESEDPVESEDDHDEPEAVNHSQFASQDVPFYRNPEASLSELSVFENSLKSNHVLAVIKESLEFYGTVILTLLSGQVTINGYRPRCQESLTIYSPKGVNWVCVSPKNSKRPGKDKVDWHGLNKNFTRAQLERIQANFESQTDAIVLLQRNTASQRLVEGFEKHMAQNVFPQVNTSNRPLDLTESLLHCLVQTSDGQRTVQVPQVWNKLRLQADSRMMFVGGKGVGKSSLLRYLVNRSLGQFPKLLLIDLDIGQPELFVSQTVSCTLLEEPLLGPGFFLNKQPERAYVVGHVNIVMCAEQYARAVTQLALHVQRYPKYNNLPWLINTMGYNKGFGTELVALLVDRFRPTDLVQIESSMAINNFDSPLEWSTLKQTTPIVYTSDEFAVKEIPKYTLHKLASAVPPKDRGAWGMSAKDLRYSNLLARLSSCLRGNAKTLTDSTPVAVSLELLKIQHLTSEDYTREELIQGMEANVVYLCRQDEGPPECLGIGVVRAIDYEHGKLYLVPAMPLVRLTLVNCLILGGELTLPQGYFKNQGTDVSSSVPFVFNLEDSKSSKSIQQIYHRTPAFLGVPGNQKRRN
ncbi:hypothetical protein KR067_004730 [Drosophila pandora]|nr:hypothetical protein KR067_004730 [Drosophila pandora]